MVFIPTLPHQSGPVLGTDDTLTQSPLAFLSKTHTATLRENKWVSEVGAGRVQNIGTSTTILTVVCVYGKQPQLRGVQIKTFWIQTTGSLFTSQKLGDIPHGRPPSLPPTERGVPGRKATGWEEVG